MSEKPSLSEQASYWDSWHAGIGANPAVWYLTERKCRAVLSLLAETGLERPAILEIGCGTGWMADKLSQSGQVTALDLSEGVIREATAKYPHIRFLAGDAETLPLPRRSFDLIVTMETVPHVADQERFFARAAALLKPGGYLIVTCQNRFVYERRSDVAPPGPGQIRKWLTMGELKGILRRHFRILRAFTLAPVGHLGWLRVVNSPRLAWALKPFLSASRQESLKERLGFGQTLVVSARLRDAGASLPDAGASLPDSGG